MVLNRILNKNLFAPLFSFLRLREQRGRRWAELVDHLNTLPRTAPEVIAFRLTVDRLRRAQGGKRHRCQAFVCASCASDILEYYEGTEEELLDFYYFNLSQVLDELQRMPRRRQPEIEEMPAAAVRAA
jgi:hypothetical protein